MSTDIAFVSLISEETAKTPVTVQQPVVQGKLALTVHTVADCTDEQRATKLRSIAVDWIKKMDPTSVDTLGDSKSILEHASGSFVLVWGDTAKEKIEVHKVYELKLRGWTGAYAEKKSVHVGTFSTHLFECMVDLKEELVAEKARIKELEANDYLAENQALHNNVDLLEGESVLLRLSLEEAERELAQNATDKLKAENEVLIEALDRNYDTIKAVRVENAELRERLSVEQGRVAELEVALARKEKSKKEQIEKIEKIEKNEKEQKEKEESELAKALYGIKHPMSVPQKIPVPPKIATVKAQTTDPIFRRLFDETIDMIKNFDRDTLLDRKSRDRWLNTRQESSELEQLLDEMNKLY